MTRFKSVLLVEDDPITILVCDRIIKMNTFSESVKSCENGKFAIDYLKELTNKPDGMPPEIIFLDINMPVMNGWDFLDEFEVLKPVLPHTPRIFILSSTVDPEDYKRAKSYPSVESFISKPLSKQSLDEIP